MDFIYNDIYVLNVRGVKTAWINQELLLKTTQLKEVYLRKMRGKYKKNINTSLNTRNFLPDTGASWRWGKHEGQFYYCLDNVPNRAPKYYRDMFPDEQTLLESYNKAVDNMGIQSLNDELHSYIREHYKEYISAYEYLEEQKSKALAKACAAVEFGVEKLKTGEARKDKLKFFAKLSAAVNKIGLRFIPSNARILKEKILAVYSGLKSVTDVISIKNLGNFNARTYNDDEIKSWILQLRGMDINYTDAYIIRKIKEMCEFTGKKTPSERWTGSIIESHNTKYITSEMRFGKGSKRAWFHNSYIPVKNALFAGDCWQVDGTRVNLIAHKADDGKERFLYIIAVRDVHSGDILGYSFDYKEDRWSVINAVKMAVQYAEYLPYEIVFDRFPGHNSEEGKNMLNHMQRLGVKVTITHKATGKAHIERGFGTLQTVFMQDSPYYYGEGVKSMRPAAHRSPEYLNRMQKKAKREGWDFNAALEETTQIVENYRNTELCKYSRKYKKVNNTPAELHAMSEKPNVRIIDNVIMSLLFGLKKTKQMTHNGIIRTEIYKTEYFFKIEEYDIISQNKDVIISYYLEDLSRVYLFKKKHDFLIYLGDAINMERVQLYGPAAEFNRLGKEKKRIKELEYKRKEEYQKAISGAEPDEVALLMEQLTNKKSAEEAETVYLLNQSKQQGLKKASGGFDDIPDALDVDVRNQY